MKQKGEISNAEATGFMSSLAQKRGFEKGLKCNLDPFIPTSWIYYKDSKTNIVVGVARLRDGQVPSGHIPKITFPKYVYHFTKSGKDIITSGKWRFFWQQRDKKVPDEVLSKYWFCETDEKTGRFQTHCNVEFSGQFNSFSLAQITRTACFFGGKKGSNDADRMRHDFGTDVLQIDFTQFKTDVENWCKEHYKIVFTDKVTYQKKQPCDFYPLPIMGKSRGEVGKEVSSIIKNLINDGTAFNKTWEHRFEHEIRVVFFDEYATEDPDEEYIDVPFSKGAVSLIESNT